MSGEQKLSFETLDKECYISIEKVQSEKEGCILRIEVENRVTLRLWICDVLETKVQEITKHIADNIDECFAILKGALSDNDSNLIKKGEDLELVISVVVGPLKKPISFPLKAQIMGKDQIFDKRLEIIHRELNIREKAKIHSFKFSSTNKSIDLQLSNDNKTVTRVNSTSAWKTIIGDTPFPSSGRHKFTIRIDKSSDNNFYFMIGVALKPANFESGSYLSTTGWVYYCNCGQKYNGGKNETYGIKVSKNGTKVTVIVDMDAQIIGFKLAGFPMGPAYQLNLNDDQKKVLFPVMDLYTVNDFVTLAN